MKNSKNVIIGIDPGTNKMGYGIISIDGTKVSFIAMGYIDLSKFTTPYMKLGHIYERVLGLVKEFTPTSVAFEAPFFGENVQSMLKLGRAQGVAIAAAATVTSEIYEYTPTKVKIAVAGNGRASKEQVASMLQLILKLETLPKNLDSTDGLAVALCHYYQTISSIKSTKGGGWGDFIKKNPDRVKQ